MPVRCEGPWWEKGMFEKILLPTDGSSHSAEAAAIAGELAKRHRGAVQPIVAVEYDYIAGEDISEEMTRSLHRRIETRAQAALQEAADAIQKAGGRAEAGKVVEGAPVDAILAAAEEGEYDLIVMGSRGVSLDRGHERLVGSVTERVLHRAPCPVLVIRAVPKGKP
jgi:nucleotide-binding universal stress UspA family protein